MIPAQFLPDQLSYIPGFIAPTQASALLLRLQTELAWQEESLRMFGKIILAPRLVCWYGDSNAYYRYSGVDHTPLAWTDTLLNIKEKLQQVADYTYNSVLGNMYRDGSDSMGWHADDEKELGKHPIIASLSFGETRLFKARRNDKSESIDLQLAHGSLLLMSGNFQQHWQHCIPKTRRKAGMRINLTFRHITI